MIVIVIKLNTNNRSTFSATSQFATRLSAKFKQSQTAILITKIPNTIKIIFILIEGKRKLKLKRKVFSDEL